MSDGLNALVRDPKFWAAVVLLVQTLLFYFLPNFPQEIWGALSALLAVVFGALAGTQAVKAGRAAHDAD